MDCDISFYEFSLGLEIDNHILESATDTFNIRCFESLYNYDNGFVAESEASSLIIMESENLLDKIKEFFRKIKEKIIKLYNDIKDKIAEKIRQHEVNKKLKAAKKLLVYYKKADIRSGEKFSYIDSIKYSMWLRKFINDAVSISRSKLSKPITNRKEFLNIADDLDKEFKSLAEKYQLDADEKELLNMVELYQCVELVDKEQAEYDKKLKSTIDDANTFIDEYQKMIDDQLDFLKNTNENVTNDKDNILISDVSSMTTSTVTKTTGKIASWIKRLTKFMTSNITKGINFLDRHISLKAAFSGGVVAPLNISYAAHVAAKAACNRQDWDAVNALAKVSNIAGAVGVAGGAYSLHRAIKYAKTGK